tara:strand:- start:952 stop:1626 length:675 start_codon:yes stop_codon:yes gene_type:complete
MPFISSCNIACGGHFGNKKTIDETLKLAIQNNVLVGAHPSFPDQKNFGRTVLKITEAALKQSIVAQLDLFLACLANCNLKIHHIKPHGALYNLIAKDKLEAVKFIKITKKYLQNCFLYVPYNSKIAEVALENNIKIKYEAFADRNYNDDLTLVSRTQENAIILDTDAVTKHLVRMVKTNTVATISGSEKEIKAATFCIHGDNENSVGILPVLATKLKNYGIEIG